MVGWTGAINIHIINLSNKPTGKGVCLKAVCDALTCVMVGMEFVEASTERAFERCAEEGRSAAVFLRLMEPWHNKAPRILIVNA
jgi:hypothetical protein